jgi:hypothetical protein
MVFHPPGSILGERIGFAFAVTQLSCASEAVRTMVTERDDAGHRLP